MARASFNGTLLNPSKYLVGEDLCGKDGKPRDFTLTIKNIVFEDLVTTRGGSECRAIIYFNEAQKGMVVNRTKENTICALHGPKAENWPGKRITLYTKKAKAFGELKLCIFVRDTPPADVVAMTEPITITTETTDAN